MDRPKWEVYASAATNGAFSGPARASAWPTSEISPQSPMPFGGARTRTLTASHSHSHKPDEPTPHTHLP